MTLDEQKLFDGGLASCRAANFPWWQDDHNYYIDLRISLPMRWACQAIADRIGADHPDDTLYLFWEEIMDVSGGRRPYDKGLRSLVEQRNQYFDYWLDRRLSLPKVVGTIPESVNDPILIEIFGLNSHFLRAVEAAGSNSTVETLTGVPASKGTGRGPAPVLHNAGDLHRLSPGEVLVCESTSPNWTPPSPRSPPACATAAAPCPTRRSSAANTASPRSPRPAWPRWSSPTGTRSRPTAPPAGVTVRPT